MERKEMIDFSHVYEKRVTVADDVVELSSDFLLPEQFDDAKRVIRVEGTLRPGGRYISGREAEYEGEMVYSVLYLTDSNCIKNAVFKTKYSKSITLPEGIEDSFSTFPVFSGVECKLVNPRKMHLRCNIKLNFSGCEKVNAMPEFTGATPQEDSLSCEVREEYGEYLRTVTVRSADNRISRDFEIESSAPPVKEIVSCSLFIKPVEQTVTNGVIAAVAKAILRVVYLTKNEEDVEYSCTEKDFRLDTTFSNEEIEEEFEGSIQYYVKELSVSVSKDSSGDNRYFEVDFTYDACGRFYACGECTFASDVYSCDYECDIMLNNLELERFLGVKSRKEKFEGTVDAPHICELLAPCAEIGDVRHKYDEESGNVFMDMDVNISAFLRGEDGRLSVFSHELPIRISFEDVCSNKVDCFATLCDYKVELKAESILISLEVEGSVHVFDIASKKVVGTVGVNKESPREDTSGLPITFYYPEDGESLWDIAKKYGSTVDVIMSANELSDEKIGKKVLLIPSKRKKPLFSRVITNE